MLGLKEWDSDPPCEDPNPIDFTWTLSKNGIPVHSGHLQEFDVSGGGARGRVFGGFKGESGATYSVQIHVDRISDELRALHPSVEIEGLMPELYSHDISQFFLALAFFLGLLIVLMTSIIMVMRQRDELVRGDAEDNALPHPQS